MLGKSQEKLLLERIKYYSLASLPQEGGLIYIYIYDVEKVAIPGN